MQIARWILWASGALYLSLGVAFGLAPETMAGVVGIGLGSVTADNDVRAVYGGANLGLGVFFCLAGARPEWARPALWALLLALGGMAAARVLSWIVAGLPEPIGYLLHASEVAGAALAAFGLSRLPE